MRFARIEPFQVAICTVPAQFGSAASLKIQKRERLYTIQVICLKKVFRLFPMKKIQQNQPPAAAVGRIVVVFYKGAVQQAGRFAVFRSDYPGASRFGVARKKKDVIPCFLPGNGVGRPRGRLIAVVREDKSGSGRQVGDGTHFFGFRVSGFGFRAETPNRVTRSC